MKRITYYFLFAALLSSTSVGAQNSIMHLTQSTLMHEVRETPSPLDGQHITMNPPRFMCRINSLTSALYSMAWKVKSKNHT